MKMIFVRHGQTKWNAEERLQGQLDAELSELGFRQARQTAEALADKVVDSIYSSDLQRAYVTAEIIAEKHGLPVTRQPVLREVCLGEWQGLSLAEVAARYPTEYEAYRTDPMANRPPGAERIESLISRVRGFIEGAVQGNLIGKTIVVVTHGGIIRGALCCAFGAGPELYRRVKVDNASLTAVEFESMDRPLALFVNDVCHLRPMDASSGVPEM